MDTTFIYALTEPGTHTIRYFGKADDPQDRRTRHIREANAGEEWHVSRWIRKLLKAGQRPDVHVLCKVPQNDWKRFERAFITLGRQGGFALTNLTDGGDGMGSGKNHPRPNLGKITPPETVIKLRRKKGGTSKFLGVMRRADRGKWASYICLRDKRKYLGHFLSETDAALAYDAAAKKHLGKNAVLNFP